MLIRVKYDPKLGMDHPHVNSLPTWAMVGFDPIAKTMTVDVPAEDFPPPAVEDATFTGVNTHLGPVVNVGDKKLHEAWHAHLDERYSEHHGEFRPQLA